MNSLPAPWLRVGVTQRRLPAGDSTVERDALDATWNDWFAEHLPSAIFLSIPNFVQPEQALRHIGSWGLNALILSGGEDVGGSPVRDAMEMALLDHARKIHMPVLGVCRGMQVLHCHAGGDLVSHPGHVGQPHLIESGEQVMTVNSWHRFAITSLQSDWRALAVAKDGSIEAMQHLHLPWLGLMWHPERPLGNPAPMKQWITDALSSSRTETGS